MSNVLEILGDSVPAVATTKAAAGISNNMGLVSLAASVAGGFTGYKAWKKHPVLGALAGLEAGQVVLLAKGDSNDHRAALTRMLGTGVGVVTSLKWKKHPAWGFILGSLGAGFVADLALRKQAWTRISGANDDDSPSAVARLMRAVGPMAGKNNLT